LWYSKLYVCADIIKLHRLMTTGYVHSHSFQSKFFGGNLVLFLDVQFHFQSFLYHRSVGASCIN